MSRFHAVIFDVDGTLVDSNDAHARAWLEALREHGQQVDFERIRSLIGMGGDNLLPEVAGLEKDSEPGKQISQRRSELFKQVYLQYLKPLPGARPLVERLHADGFKLIVASSAKQDELGPLLKIAGVADLLTETTSADDASNSKPDPDIIQVALQKLGLPAEQAVMIGDTPYDIQAAQKAHVATIALRCGGWQDTDLAGALAIYDTPADLLAHYDQSPLGGETGGGTTPADATLEARAMGDQPA